MSEKPGEGWGGTVYEVQVWPDTGLTHLDILLVHGWLEMKYDSGWNGLEEEEAEK